MNPTNGPSASVELRRLGTNENREDQQGIRAGVLRESVLHGPARSCTVLHRPAFRRNERPANLLMQLQFQIWKCNAFRASPADCRWPGDRPTIGLHEIGSIDDPSVRGARRGSSRWRPRRPRRCRVGRTRAAAIGSPMGRRRAPPHQSELKRRPAVSPSIPGNVEFARTSVASGAAGSHTTSTGKRVRSRCSKRNEFPR